MKPTLFAIALEHVDPVRNSVVATEIVYAQGHSASYVRQSYLMGLPPAERRRTRVVACAPALGYFCDHNGENLSTE